MISIVASRTVHHSQGFLEERGLDSSARQVEIESAQSCYVFNSNVSVALECV